MRRPDHPTAFTVGRMLGAAKHQRPRICVVCGKVTWDEFYGEPLCYPWDEAGRVVARCKWEYRDVR